MVKLAEEEVNKRVEKRGAKCVKLIDGFLSEHLFLQKGGFRHFNTRKVSTKVVTHNWKQFKHVIKASKSERISSAGEEAFHIKINKDLS